MSKSSLPVLAAVKAIIKNGNKFLIVKSYVFNDLYFWDIPGGKIEHGESPYDTLNREVNEEVGIKVEIKKPVGIWWFFREKDGKQVVCTTFLCSSKTTDIDITKNLGQDNIREAKWVTKQEFLDGDYKVSHPSLTALIASLEE